MISKYQARKNHQLAVEETLVTILAVGIALIIILLSI